MKRLRCVRRHALAEIRRRPCMGIKGLFWTYVTGNISPFVKVVFHSKLLSLTRSIAGLTKSGATPYEYPALLLFALPLLFTLQKLLLLFRFGERSHQLAVEQQGRPPGTRLQKYTRQSLTYLLLSLFRTFVSSEFSRSMSSPISCAI